MFFFLWRFFVFFFLLRVDNRRTVPWRSTKCSLLIFDHLYETLRYTLIAMQINSEMKNHFSRVWEYLIGNMWRERGVRARPNQKCICLLFFLFRKYVQCNNYMCWAHQMYINNFEQIKIREKKWSNILRTDKSIGMPNNVFCQIHNISLVRNVRIK